MCISGLTSLVFSCIDHLSISVGYLLCLEHFSFKFRGTNFYHIGAKQTIFVIEGY